MSLIITNYGKTQLLDKMIKAELVENEDFILKLFKNELLFVTTTNTDFLEEANFTNYESKTLTRNAWNPSTLVGESGEATYSDTLSWTCGTTGNTVYGYWIEGSVSGLVLWGEVFNTPRTLVDGDILEITPKFRLNSI